MAYSISTNQLPNIILIILNIIFLIDNCDLSATINNTINNNTNNNNINRTTLVGDFSSVDDFRNFVEHKIKYANDNNNSTDNVDYNYDDGKDLDDRDIYQKRRRRRNTINNQLNICNYVCNCTDDLIEIVCDLRTKNLYDQNFGKNFEIPVQAKYLKILLEKHSNIRLQEGFFNQNTIQQFVIEGSISDDDYNDDDNVGNEFGLSQIEIGTNAFKGNHDPNAEINITNCGKVVLRAESFAGEFTLHIINTAEVYILENAFKSTSFLGIFENIKDLRIQEKGFYKANATLEIISSAIDELHRFEASLREVRFSNCTITTIDTGTFDVIHINSIIFDNCKIDTVKKHAITEKLLSSQFQITGGSIRIIESNAIAGGFTEFILSHNKIESIEDNAIFVSAANATIANNHIKYLGNQWLHIDNLSNITISKNQFGDFGQMILKETNAQLICKFEENSIANPSPNSLNISRYCAFRKISFQHLCSCDMKWLNELTSHDLRSETYCRIDDEDTLKYCLNTTIFNLLKYEMEICDNVTLKSDCEKNYKKYVELLSPTEQETTNHDKLQLIYILMGIGIMSIIVIIIFITATKCITTGCSKTGQIQNPDNVGGGSGAGTLAGNNGTNEKAEHKLFSNEDRRLIQLTLATLEEKYPPAVFEEVERNTKILLGGNINEMQRVQSIGNIVQVLGELENSGIDFIAFTEILYKHLNSSRGTAPQPIEPTYSEPAFPDRNFGIGADNVSITNFITPDGQTNIDHIYAEPTSVQQPLLTNEYASPADRSESDLYSEPFSNDRDHKIIPPYAVINTGGNYPHSIGSMKLPPLPPPSIPSTSKPNLPDVLNAVSSSSPPLNHNNNNNQNTPNSSRHMTNVQKIAQNFANDPNFHITRSPNSNRRIPQYTIPANKTRNIPNSNLLNDTTDNNNISSNYSPKMIGGGGATMSYATGDNQSDHSGGSDVTVQMDDIIEYADN